MRKLVLLVCMVSTFALAIQPAGHEATAHAGMIPSWESASGSFGFSGIASEHGFPGYSIIRVPQ